MIINRIEIIFFFLDILKGMMHVRKECDLGDINTFNCLLAGLYFFGGLAKGLIST